MDEIIIELVKHEIDEVSITTRKSLFLVYALRP